MALNRAYDVITFDCYGTLVDWNRGIRAAFRAMATADGVEVDLDALLAAYHDLEPVVEAEEFRPYREVLAEAARRAAARLGWALSATRARYLAESLPDWPLFPDTNPALQRLAGAGYRLGILSNVDDDLLAGTRHHLAVPFELIVTAQQVCSYKPAPGHFLAARARIGNARWLHAAQSYFHDIAPATALGIATAWINRLHEAPTGDARPLAEFATLTELAAWLA